MCGKELQPAGPLCAAPVFVLIYYSKRDRIFSQGENWLSVCFSSQHSKTNINYNSAAQPSGPIGQMIGVRPTCGSGPVLLLPGPYAVGSALHCQIRTLTVISQPHIAKSALHHLRPPCMPRSGPMPPQSCMPNPGPMCLI